MIKEEVELLGGPVDGEIIMMELPEDEFERDLLFRRRYGKPQTKVDKVDVDSFEQVKYKATGRRNEKGQRIFRMA